MSLLSALGKQASTFVSLHGANISSSSGGGEVEVDDTDGPNNTLFMGSKKRKSPYGGLVKRNRKNLVVNAEGEGAEALKQALALCHALQHTSGTVGERVDAARQSGVLTPGLVRQRKHRRKLHPELFDRQLRAEDDVMLLDDAVGEANAAYMETLRPLRFEAISLVDLINANVRTSFIVFKML